MRPSLAPCPLVVRPLSGALTPDFVRTLHSRPARDESGLFVAEGARFLAAAWEQAASFAGLVVCPALLNGEDAWKMVDTLRKAHVPTLRVDPKTYASLSLCRSSPEDPAERLPAAARQGILAILRQRWEPLPDRVRRNDLWIGVESVRTPGNLGTLLRCGDAVGASGVIVFDRSEAGTPSGPDPYSPAVVRATMGSLFAHRFIRTTHRAFRRWSGRSEISVVGATPEAQADYRSITYRRPVVLMMGDERAGLSDGQRGSCDRLVRIPMIGGADSLNLAMAGTLMLYEVHNQRHPVRRRQR